MSGPRFRKVRFFLHLGIVILTFPGPASQAAEILPPGFRPKPVGVHALVGGKVIPKPGEVLDGATIILRDGYIETVGINAAVPADARVWDMKGLTIYAGFIEPYLTLGASNAPVASSASEPPSAAELTAGGGVDFFGVPPQRTEKDPRGPGNEVSRVTPEQRSVRTYAPDRKTLEPLRELGFTTAVVAPTRGIIRGTSALVALSEERPNEVIVRSEVFQHVALEAERGARAETAYPGSLMGVIAVLRQSFFDAQHYAALARQSETTAARPTTREFNPSLEALAPAAEGKMRVVIEPGSALMVDRAARVARELKLDFALVSCGQEWRRPALAKETGATFIVPVNFPELPKLPSDSDWEQVELDQLRAWDWAAENPAVLRQQQLDIALTTYGLADKKSFRKNLRLALDRGLSETDALAALTTAPAKLCGVDRQLGTIEAGKIANLTIVDGKGYFDPEAKVRDVWIDGRNYHAQPAKEPEVSVAAKEESPEDKDKQAKAKAEKEKKETELKELQKKRVARSPLEGRGAITNPPSQVVILSATIWTCSGEGILTNAALLLRDGKIQAVGDFRMQQTTNALVIEGRSLHITPGLIDCHSHTAILGGVNEGTLPSTAMVRIGDVVNSEADQLYQQLAGGLTTANLLHGSANPIGGQNQVIKLRDGASPEELKFDGAPPGIKFALGENVKQSNWGDRTATRFPQTRMGVRTFYANRFTAAQEYLRDWADYSNKVGQASSLSSVQQREATGRMPVPPRRNLELEAIGEIIQGQRLIHCHSYRQDEILSFLRTMESFGVKVGTLQHILEGYKVADEIAKHGAGASCFADWWAYKYEVIDAIPYAGSLMRERGVTVSFNSDSADLARRLYTEAAKAVKFGGTPEVEALKFVTINPAKQLHIDSRVGSLEPGKDADFVIWSKSPLDSTTVCLQTWIDGKKYFDRDLSGARAAALAKERDDLIAKAKKLAKLSGGGGDGESKEGSGFFRVALEHEFDRVVRHCMDEEDGR